MAGSKKWMVYAADDTTQYAVNIDESNGEVADFADYTITDNLPQLPRGMEMRYVNVSRNGSTRKVHVGTAFSGLVDGDVISLLLSSFGAGEFLSAVAWNVLSYVSQKNPKRASSNDTGMLDGDIS